MLLMLHIFPFPKQVEASSTYNLLYITGLAASPPASRPVPAGRLPVDQLCCSSLSTIDHRLWQPLLGQLLEHGGVLLVFHTFWEFCGVCGEAARSQRAVGSWRDQIHGVQRQGQDEGSRLLCSKGVQGMKVTELGSSRGTRQDLSCHAQGLRSSLFPLSSNHLNKYFCERGTKGARTVYYRGRSPGWVPKAEENTEEEEIPISIVGQG